MHAATPYGTAVPELKGLAPACGRSLSTNSCFQSGCLGRNPPASTAHTAIRSRPCQLSRRALQPTRPLGSPSPSPAGTPLRAGRHQSRVLAQGDPAEPDPGSGCRRDVPSLALIPPSLSPPLLPATLGARSSAKTRPRGTPEPKPRPSRPWPTVPSGADASEPPRSTPATHL